MGNILKGLSELLLGGNSISDVISNTENLTSQGVADSNILENLFFNKDLIEDDSNEPIYYEVKKGDNISKICKENNITISDFKKWNKISNDVIKLGVKYIVGYKNTTSSSKAIRKVVVTVTNKKVGTTIINSYPDNSLNFTTPLYEVKIETTDSNNRTITKSFKAVRFGIAYKYKGGYDKPDWTGFTEYHKYIVQSWKPEYLAGNPKNLPPGAFGVYKGFYIHTGARDISKFTVGSVGCVEIEGNGAWEEFLQTLKDFSNAPSEEALVKSKKMIVIYEKEPYPKMEEFKN